MTTTETVKQKSWFARHKILTALLAIIALIIVFAIAGGGGGDGGGTQTTTQQPAQDRPAENQPAEPAKAGIGDKVRDGKFEFVVTKVQSGMKVIGREPILQEKPQGQFVLVHVNVSNIGDAAQYLSASDQYLFDGQDKRYSADDTAWSALENNPLLEQVNPGNSVKGIIVFDVPKTVKPTKIELHDSAFSGGVTVELK
jgi:hypothetical protein